MIESWLQDRIGLLGITWAFCNGLMGCISLVGSERSSTHLSAILFVFVSTDMWLNLLEGRQRNVCDGGDGNGRCF